MSVIHKTRAIPVRIEPYSETSRIVAWVTEDHGRITTLIKGSQRPRSAFLGQYDLYQTCELLFYGRDRAGLRIARECCIVKDRPAFRTAWKATAIASHASDIAQRVMQEDAKQRDVFALLDGLLDYLETGRPAVPLVGWFELQILSRLGLAPRLVTCLSCGHTLLPATGTLRFVMGRGGVLCPRCEHTATSDNTSISPSSLAALAALQRAESPATAAKLSLTMMQVDILHDALGLFFAFHLDMQVPGRAICLDLLHRNLPAGEKSLVSPETGP